MRAWHAQRPGQGARTDLAYLPDPHGQLVFINATTVTIATLLRDLIGTHGITISRSALQQQWAQQFPPDNQTSPPHITNTRQITKALNALNKLGAINHDRRRVTVINDAILTQIANL